MGGAEASVTRRVERTAKASETDGQNQRDQGVEPWPGLWEGSLKLRGFQYRHGPIPGACFT